MRRLTPLGVAGIAVIAGISYIAINVAYNYGGNVSGLFYTSRTMDLPPEVASHTWRVRDAGGYDAQYYHLVAHDVLMRRGYWRYADNPQLRWRRIALPAVASLLSWNSGRLTDLAYVSVQIAFLFAGAYWLALYAMSVNAGAVAGAGFLLFPAVLVSLDRMTVDLALAALTVGSIHFRKSRAVYGVLLLAPLVRETGIILLAGWCVWNGIGRRWMQVAWGFACAAPAVAWWIHVRLATAPDGTPWMARYPFSGLVERTLAGHQTPGETAWLRLAGISEQIALAGIWIAIILSVLAIIRRPKCLIAIAATAFVLFSSLLGKADIWETAYAAGRTMSPLLVLLGLKGIQDRRPVYFIPVLLILPRLALQYQAQLTAALRNSGLL